MNSIHATFDFRITLETRQLRKQLTRADVLTIVPTWQHSLKIHGAEAHTSFVHTGEGMAEG